MAQLEDFQDLIVWQKARRLARLVYAVTQHIADDHLKGEIRTSAVTIGSKIAAAFETRQSAYSQEMLNLAKAACGGLRIQLNAIHERAWIKSYEYEQLLTRISEIRQLLFALENTLDFWRRQRGDVDNLDTK